MMARIGKPPGKQIRAPGRENRAAKKPAQIVARGSTQANVQKTAEVREHLHDTKTEHDAWRRTGGKA